MTAEQVREIRRTANAFYKALYQCDRRGMPGSREVLVRLGRLAQSHKDRGAELDGIGYTAVNIAKTVFCNHGT